MFDVGEEVVCIDDSPTATRGHRDLVKGKHYIVSWIGMYQPMNHPEEILCVHLEGVVRSPPQDVLNMIHMMISVLDTAGEDTSQLKVMLKNALTAPFRATRFAPLKKTDIGVLTKLLEPVKVLEDA